MNVFISGITSDIGAYICRKYIERGHNVIGTYRKQLDKTLETQILSGGGYLIHCDFEDKRDIDTTINEFAKLGLKWDIFISAVGVMSPIERFEELSIDLWEKNIYVNAVSQIRLLHGILPYREKESCVYFMTSKGINDTFPLHSAYCVSKIMLIKMCELLDDEIDDCKFIAFNPGFIRTKIINQEPCMYVSGGANVQDDKYDQMALEKVWKFILWSSKIDKKIISGRNYFVKYDDWESGEFCEFLERDDNAYKMRRSNDKWNETSVLDCYISGGIR